MQLQEQTILNIDYHLVQTAVPDQSVDFLGLDVVHLLNGILDLLLVRADVNNENQGVVVLDLLHCRLGSQWILENLIVVQLMSWWRTDAGILGVPLLLQCLRAMEGD